MECSRASLSSFFLSSDFSPTLSPLHPSSHFRNFVMNRIRSGVFRSRAELCVFHEENLRARRYEPRRCGWTCEGGRIASSLPSRSSAKREKNITPLPKRILNAGRLARSSCFLLEISRFHGKLLLTYEMGKSAALRASCISARGFRELFMYNGYMRASFMTAMVYNAGYDGMTSFDGEFFN